MPPLPPVDADEKFDMIDEEKVEPMKVQELGNGDVMISNVSSNFAAKVMCGMDPLLSLEQRS